MLSFHVKFVQTDRRMDGQTDNGKTICPDLLIWEHKKVFKIFLSETIRLRATRFGIYPHLMGLYQIP